MRWAGLLFFSLLLAACEREPRAAARETAPAGSGPFEGTLAFQSDREGSWDIYLVEADGTDLRRLTRDPANDTNPAFSPDGEWIAFASDRTGGGDLYVMDARGGSVRRLTDHPGYEGAPRWSPDGTWIAFEGDRDGRSELYRVQVESGRVEALTDSMSRKLGPAVCPAGRRIAFMDRGLIRWQIALLDLATGSITTLTDGGGNCRPTWSPDGRFLAYVSTNDSPKADLWVRDVNEGSAWKIRTRPNAHNYDPSFSPDGLALGFASTLERDPEQWDLYLADVNGRNLVQLTSGPANERFPDWLRRAGS